MTSPSDQQIVLFDVPSRPPVATWSFNAWKARFVLEYKGLDYRTEWVEYPDIKPTLEKHVPDVGEGWTIPAIRFPDGTYVMESRAIADAINARYPSPPLRIDSKYLSWFFDNGMESNYARLAIACRGVYIPLVPKRILNDKSVPYFRETREKANGGLTLEEIEETVGGDKAWEMTGPILREVTDMLMENHHLGPFFLGDEVSFVDFFWAGYLLFMKAIGADMFERVVEASGENGRVHRELLEAVKGWAGRPSR